VRLFVDKGPNGAILIQDWRDCSANAPAELRAYADRLLGAFAGKEPPAAPSIAVPVVPSAALAEPLTGREMEVLRLLASTLTAEEIAEQLYVAPSTIRTHIKNIYAKLGVARRLQAVERARELGLM
jgi:LuxR family maltose regulon positive regulatory protein